MGCISVEVVCLARVLQDHQALKLSGVLSGYKEN